MYHKHILYIFIAMLFSLNLFAQDKCAPPPITPDCKYIAPRLEGIKMTAIAPMCKCIADCSDCTQKAGETCQGETFTICSGVKCGGAKDCTPPQPSPGPQPSPCCPVGCYQQVFDKKGNTASSSSCGTYECGTREAPQTCSRTQCVDSEIDCMKWEQVADPVNCACATGTPFCTPPSQPYCPNNHCANTTCH